MTSLILRNTFYTILQPGLVAGLIPYLIIRWERVYFWPHGIGYGQLLGLVLMLVGLIIMLWCIINFALKGKGTLSPADPTKKLVVTGLYKFSRNPMYIGVLLILFGEANFFGLRSLGLYVILMLIAFQSYIVVFEEPRLRRDFGKEYIDYCNRVRRWF